MWNRLNKSMMFCQMMFGLSFYGVMVILTRFFLDDMGYSEADTMMVVGAFSAIGPLFAIAGGFIADKFLGAYRSLTIAYLGFAAGYSMLVAGAITKQVPMALMGIALASYARGLMSPSYPSLYRSTFKTQEDFENGFPVNYSVNNIGAFLGQYLFPMLALAVGFNGSFALSASFAAMALAVMVLNGQQMKAIAAEIDQQPVSQKNWLLFGLTSVAMIGLVFFMFANMDIGQNIVYAIGLAAIAYFTWLMIKSDKAQALKMGTILIMVILTTAFFVYYGQMMTSMNMVSINTMRGDLFGFIPFEPEAAMAMNPLWCMVAGPIIAWFFASMDKRNIHISTATRVAGSFILTAIAFGILTFAVKTIGTDVVIRPEWFFAIHGFLAFGEVIVGSMVVAFILSVAPKSIENFSVSLFSVAIAMSGIVGAAISTTIAMEKGQEITQSFVQTTYGDFYQLLTNAAVVMVIIALLSSSAITKMLASAKAQESDTEGAQAVKA
ncbi:peptide MFS transporter [Ferrimonas lipolytica]|uniref:Peptide MFS transporter n=1 Tax=Ferrimonas lipolytica TaxID=2724191 RepID=A0A6H1UGH2_9GAMM|nr:MFS transporter [Ferrimonas lipolytica]QIZ76892.1 peptide MFS transporter [Ferrimonas lipolytica]